MSGEIEQAVPVSHSPLQSSSETSVKGALATPASSESLSHSQQRSQFITCKVCRENGCSISSSESSAGEAVWPPPRTKLRKRQNAGSLAAVAANSHPGLIQGKASRYSDSYAGEDETSSDDHLMCLKEISECPAASQPVSDAAPAEAQTTLHQPTSLAVKSHVSVPARNSQREVTTADTSLPSVDTKKQNYRAPIFLSGQERKEYLCACCKSVLFPQAWQIHCTCGNGFDNVHRLCSSCREQIIAPKDCCPVDGTAVTKVYPDNACMRDMESLTVKCGYSEDEPRCRWTDSWISYAEHHAECSQKRISCKHVTDGCAQKIRRCEIEDHLKWKCHKHLVTCPGCRTKHLAFKMEEHLQLCKEAERVCEGGSEGQPEQMTKDSVVSTSLDGGGLPDKSNQVVDADCLPSTQQRHGLAGEHTATTNRTLTSGNTPLLLGTETVKQSLLSADPPQPTSNPDEKDDVGSFNQIVGRTDAIMAEFDLRLLSQETSFNGVLTWKIPDYSQHFEEARSGRKPSIYSPPFFTSRHGYKMCARIYLHGDGVGKGTHMSVFFAVMKGEFDALLQWPFHQKVTLTLLDQLPSRCHISETFQPDPSSSSFQRPSSEMNIASGCPRFVSLDTLRNSPSYLKENTIYVRVVVNTTSLLTY